MGTGYFHPKNGKKCAFCKLWNGDAKLVFKNVQMGYQYTLGVYGKCMKGGGNMVSTAGNNCRDYAPSYEASKLL